MESQYIPVKDLEIYKIARELSKLGWEFYNKFDWQTKKIIGDQFIEATDSVGANIVEGYSRYHYLDKIKFYYTSRASLSESKDHWLELLFERDIITEINYKKFKEIGERLAVKINNFIKSTYDVKKRNL